MGDLLRAQTGVQKIRSKMAADCLFGRIFFFPAGPVPLYILQDGPTSLGARKVLRPICGHAGIFPATTAGQPQKTSGGGGGWVGGWVGGSVSSSHNQHEQRAIRQALTSTSLWCIRPGGLDPLPRPMHECVGVCMPYGIAHRPCTFINVASVCLSVCHAGAYAHACVGIYRVPVACRWRRCVRLWARGPCVSRLCAWANCGAWAFVRACVCVTRL